MPIFIFQWPYQLVVKQNGFSMDESKDSVNCNCKIVHCIQKFGVSKIFLFYI